MAIREIGHQPTLLVCSSLRDSQYVMHPNVNYRMYGARPPFRDLQFSVSDSVLHISGHNWSVSNSSITFNQTHILGAIWEGYTIHWPQRHWMLSHFTNTLDSPTLSGLDLSLLPRLWPNFMEPVQSAAAASYAKALPAILRNLATVSTLSSAHFLIDEPFRLEESLG